MYILTQKALNKINDSRPTIIWELSIALGSSESTINRQLRQNVPNGDLTKVASIEVIREATGLKDSQILEEVKSKAVA
jgi:hypothetical protein